ncbi:MAG: DUF554 domain-containing protein [Bacteroidaceae bacterium]
MIGTIVNALAILSGSVIGALARKGLNKKYSEALYTTMGLAATVLGVNAVVSYLPKSNYPVLFIVCLAVGGLIGTMLNLDGRFKGLASKVSGSELAKGLTTGILLFCVGTLSMVGPLMSALYGDNTYLFTNAALDLVTSAVLASTYGIGMAFAAPVLFLWQGGIYLVSLYAGTLISDALITELSIVGGLLIAASGLAILEIKDCKVLNLLPALFLPIVFFVVKWWLFS